MTKFTKTGLWAAGLCAAMAATSAQAVELRAWNIHVEDYPNSIALESFAAEVADKTGGEVTIKLFHNGVLGSQPDAIEQVRLGALDIGQFNLGPMGTSIPETNVVSLPFIFPGIPEMYELMDGDVGDAISAGMEKKGIKALAWYDSGARSFYNSVRPINSPADVEGLKLRVMNNQLFVGMVEALDGNATPMAFGEVYQSIKTGVVDGAENNPPSYESVSHYEVAQYYSLTEHLIIPECVCVSTRAWEALTPEQQEIMQTAARNSAQEQRELWQAREASAMKAVEAGGVTINKIADKGPFQERMSAVYDGFLEANPDLTELVNLIRGN
ncbi:tripartite ATP-independent transporter DctP family solute receptor [Litoreibacter ponti]|uniref:Tripartite ATP-independent transporter DctP family solute receptor n=1 Tax=Litoreibacter ponti TaxID=1510457 RepID=A0A2T6BJR1_9RHOB|nr:TRAP transporter substrate-binding protein [Litoreibacter ponti]PTX56303.1 tripartite ATP-independent transporter DctP family solute receptor [Litoreibacter ponti]